MEEDVFFTDLPLERVNFPKPSLKIKEVKSHIREKTVLLIEKLSFLDIRRRELWSRKFWYALNGADGVTARCLFELTAEDLMGSYQKPLLGSQRPFLSRLYSSAPLIKVQHWYRAKIDKFRSFRRGSAAVVVRSRIAFFIIVFVGVVTALQLIPPILEFFR